MLFTHRLKEKSLTPYSSTGLTDIYYSCHHEELDMEINGVKRRFPCWFKFSGEKTPQKYDFVCNQPKETFPKLLDMGCCSAS